MAEPQAIDIVNNDDSSTVIHLYSASQSPKAVIIIWPALGVKASYYSLLAAELEKAGYAAITADLRGNGHSSIRPSRSISFGYKDVLDQEYTSVQKYATGEFPDNKILLFGHSLGGQLSCLFASRQSSRLDGLILSATCSVYFKGWKGFSAYRILLATQFINLVSKLVGYFPGKKLGFGGTEARGLIADWSRQARTGQYNLDNDDFDYEAELKTVSLPILAISYARDEMAPKGAVEHLLSKLISAKKEHLHLAKDDQRNDSFTHFSWAKKPSSIVRIVDDWVNRIQ